MKQLRCNHCEKVMAKLKPGSLVIPSIIVYCPTCNDRLSAAAINSIKGGRNDMPDFMRKAFYGGD
jgi:phage FluMu protein Com